MRARRALPVRFALLAGVATLMPGMVAASQRIPVDLGQTQPFAPPSGPFVLTRVLERALPDGAAIVTRRSYEIRFVPEASGFRVEGTLLTADVAAPPSLDFLAQLERARPDTGLFPMRLNASGALLQGDSASPPDETLRKAADLTTKAIVAAKLGRTATREATTFIDQVGRQRVNTEWPVDLFRPAQGRRSETMTVPLPGGTTGRVDVQYEASASHGGLLSLFRRTVTTHLGETSRRTVETWTLESRG